VLLSMGYGGLFPHGNH